MFALHCAFGRKRRNSEAVLKFPSCFYEFNARPHKFKKKTLPLVLNSK